MATVNKNFKVKHGLVVEGTTGTINGEDILTKSEADIDYIIDQVGGSGVSTNTPSTLVLRDANGDFAAGTITAEDGFSGDLEGDVTGNVTGDLTGNADTASALETARNIELTGDVTGTVSFDGTSNVQISTTLNADFATDSEVATAKQEAIDAAEGYTDTELSSHNSSTSGVHGVTGDVVGTSDTQTLTNKTLGSGTNLSVNLDMNGNKIEDLGTPTAGTDATTKNYVDDADTTTLGSANSYTDGRETAITTAYETYADQAEADAISSAASDAAALYAPLAGATFTGAVVLAADPTQALGAATKQYVDSITEGLHVKAAVLSATDANLSATYSNGTSGEGATLNLGSAATLTIGGVSSWAQYDGILVKDQTNGFENGRYFVDQVGGASTDWILKRCTSCDEATEIPSAYVFVQSGDYEGTGWVAIVENPSSFEVGVDDISWYQFSGAGEYTAGLGIALDGTSIAIDDTYTATKSYVDGEITDLDTAAQGYANTAEGNANDYTDDRETAITTAYQNYADTAEADAKIYTDEEIAALDSDDIEEGSNNLYFTNQRAIDAVGGTIGDAIDALDTDDIEEGATNLYFTDGRAKTSAAELLTGATLTNITITGNGSGLTITAENGVADSDTDDLAEGTTNKYFTDTRAKDAVAAALGDGIEYETGAFNVKVGEGLDIGGGTGNEIVVDRNTVDTWYDANGAAATAQEAAEDYADGLAGNYEVAGAAAAAQAAAEGYADGLAANYDPAGSAATAETDARNYADELIGDATVDGTAGNTVTARIATAVSNLVDSAPATLDTLNELAAALQDNPDIISDLQDIAAGKQDTLTAGANIDITGATISVTGLDTDDVSEGTNLYFTDARAVDALEAVVPNFTEVDINSVATQVAATGSATAATATTAYSFAKADYRSAKFLVKVAYGTHTEISEVLLTLDTSDNVAITEYAIIGTNGTLSTISASVVGANVNLLVTPTNNSSVTVMGTLLA